MNRIPGIFSRRCCTRGLLLMALVGVAFLWSLANGCGGKLGEARRLDARGDLAGAVAQYRQVLERDPSNLEALAGAATNLWMMQRHDEALILQERVVSLNPGDVLTRVELGFNYLNHQNRPAAAVHVFEEAADLERTAKHLTFLAQAQVASGDLGRGESALREALVADASYARAYGLLIDLLQSVGRQEEVQAVKEQAQLHGVRSEPVP